MFMVVTYIQGDPSVVFFIIFINWCKIMQMIVKIYINKLWLGFVVIVDF